MKRYAMLPLAEGVRLDADRLLALYSDLGESAAEDVIARTMEDLCGHVAAVHSNAGAGDLTGVLRHADALSRLAGRIGMTTLARVAQDVAATGRFGDAAAHAATLSRLSRIAERSLCEIWDLYGSAR